MKGPTSRALGFGLVALLSGAGTASPAEPPASDHCASHQDAAAADPHAAHAAALEKPRYTVTERSYSVPDVQLLDETGAPVALRTLLDSERPLAVNFIFTTCSTICPVMTATFAQMRRELGPAGERVRLVSISIDPEYDRPAVLKQYAERFGAEAGWTFLTGDGTDVARVLQSFEARSGSKMNHRPLTLLRKPHAGSWVRIDGLASGEDLAREVQSRLLD
jgi:protein SCO1/2